MTLALPAARLPAALAASLGIHAVLGAAVAAVVAGWQPGSVPPSVKPDAFVATVRATPPAEAPRKPREAPRAARGSASAAPGLPLPAAPYYYRSSELSERPAPMERIEPRFPPGAPDTGRLKLRLYINEAGLVDAVHVTEAEPEGVFEEAATQAFGAARFRPGHKDRIPVKSQIALEVRFGEPLPLTRRPQ
jgi:outer membrane biosynthesis protein TonB